jgi:hypothetical protein
MNKKLHTARYVIADFIAAALAWSLFFYNRKISETPLVNDTLQLVLNDRNFYTGILVIPVFWLLLYTMAVPTTRFTGKQG